MHRRSLSGYLAIALACGLLALAVHGYSQREYVAARQHYAREAKANAEQGVRRLDGAFRSIYDNLKTLASLPSLRTIDRHGSNLSDEAKVTFQQLYANLASGVDVSEVYIVPADFNPEHLDAATGKPEEPIMMFDSLIVNAGGQARVQANPGDPLPSKAQAQDTPPEVETFEYRQLVDHMRYLAANFPRQQAIGAFSSPLVSGPEIITCDNTDFIRTRKDADRTGVMFSMPFYGPDMKFKGSVTAIILSSALRKLLPDDNFVLVNPGYGIANARPGNVHMAQSHQFIAAGLADPGLIFSTVLPISIVDPRSPWKVWAGRDDEVFFGGTDARAVRLVELSGYALVSLLTFIAMLSWYFVQRDIAKQVRANALLAKAHGEAKAAEAMALRAEAEAREMAQPFKTLNQDVTRLNMELAAKMRDLQEAQAESLRREKLAQLGQLTATVAHELRNPMAAIRNTAFVVRRRIADKGLDLESQLVRIDSGIARCDAIISQLLDFARFKTPDLVETDIDNWLMEVVEEEALALPERVEVRLVCGLAGATADIDTQRIRRVLTNLLGNASEAMVGRDGTAKSERPPVITLATRLTQRGVEITVTDTGPGIPVELLAKVREPLFTTKNFGTGLGLPAVEKILELHGGGLDIKSAPGQGASVTAWFPRRRTQASAA
jgi:signal transduction histidine kinase